MNDKLYRIKLLEWIGRFESQCASTPFGNYYIGKRTENKSCLYRLSYCFDEYYDEGYFDLKTVRECKKKAEKDWFNRIRGALEEVK